MNMEVERRTTRPVGPEATLAAMQARIVDDKKIGAELKFGMVTREGSEHSIPGPAPTPELVQRYADQRLAAEQRAREAEENAVNGAQPFAYENEAKKEPWGDLTSSQVAQDVKAQNEAEEKQSVDVDAEKKAADEAAMKLQKALEGALAEKAADDKAAEKNVAAEKAAAVAATDGMETVVSAAAAVNSAAAAGKAEAVDEIAAKKAWEEKLGEKMKEVAEEKAKAAGGKAAGEKAADEIVAKGAAPEKAAATGTEAQVPDGEIGGSNDFAFAQDEANSAAASSSTAAAGTAEVAAQKPAAGGALIREVTAYRVFMRNEQWLVTWAADGSESWERFDKLDSEALREKALALQKAAPA
jgi:hypothetical protein